MDKNTNEAKLTQLIGFIKQFFDLCKSHLILTLITLFSDKVSFSNFSKEVKDYADIIAPTFFVDVKSYKSIFENEFSEGLKDLIDRDTFIYKNNLDGKKIKSFLFILYYTTSTPLG